MITAADVEADPDRYALPAYGPWVTPQRAAALFNQWELDRGTTSPALCRRCGRALRFVEDGQQLHDWCDPNYRTHGAGAPENPEPTQPHQGPTQRQPSRAG